GAEFTGRGEPEAPFGHSQKGASGAIRRSRGFAMRQAIFNVILSGTMASLATASVLAIAARAEGRRAAQPVNATGHWLLGDAAASATEIDVKHSLTGLSTHQAASIFWAAIHQAARRLRPGGRPWTDAIGVSALAALVDYGLVPRR